MCIRRFEDYSAPPRGRGAKLDFLLARGMSGEIRTGLAKLMRNRLFDKRADVSACDGSHGNISATRWHHIWNVPTHCRSRVGIHSYHRHQYFRTLNINELVGTTGEAKEKLFTEALPSDRDIEDFLFNTTIVTSHPPIGNDVTYFDNRRNFFD
jgi:hypothetical protein